MPTKIKVENYRGLAAKFAWAAWKKLPPRTRAWISIEDMVADGLWFLLYSPLNKNVPGHYRPESGVKFSTHAYQVLRNFYNEYYIDFHYAQMRCDNKTTSIEELQARYSQNSNNLIGADEALILANSRKPAALRKASVMAGSIAQADEELDWCLAVEAMVKIYKQATDTLKAELVRWFLQAHQTKFHIHGKRFLAARDEFLKLAASEALDIRACRHIMHSPSCLDKMSRALLWVPFDISNPTPGLRGHDTRWRPSTR